ncbi:oxidoreductase [Pseudoteredinibacter isoporae]
MPDKLKSALVIGATGLVGRALLMKIAKAPGYGRIVALSRRPIEDCPGNVDNIVLDFDHLADHAAVFNVDCFFSCLGTTRKQAGSIEAQRVVDYDYQRHAAELARAAGVKHLLLVSSSGADAKSASAYMKMKGELELAVHALNFDKLSILQPSLLVGKREHHRLGESLGESALNWLNALGILKRYRPIAGSQVADALLYLVENQTGASEVYRLDEIFTLT